MNWNSALCHLPCPQPQAFSSKYLWLASIYFPNDLLLSTFAFSFVRCKLDDFMYLEPSPKWYAGYNNYINPCMYMCRVPLPTRSFEPRWGLRGQVAIVCHAALVTSGFETVVNFRRKPRHLALSRSTVRLTYSLFPGSSPHTLPSNEKAQTQQGWHAVERVANLSSVLPSWFSQLRATQHHVMYTFPLTKWHNQKPITASLHSVCGSNLK
jgi:hypothetical protein